MWNRLNLWYNVHKRPNNLVMRSLKKLLRKSKQWPKGSCKNWKGQLFQHREEMGDKLPINWINEPTNVKIIAFNECYLKVILKRQHSDIYQNENCNWILVIVRKIDRHYKGYHYSITPTTNTSESYQRPITDFNKPYKTIGLLKRHIQKCHPQHVQFLVNVKILNTPQCNLHT